MKFAHEYEKALVRDGFPADWLDSAISYGQLKKCIKRVQKELASLGLDVETLRRLLQSVEEKQQHNTEEAQRLQQRQQKQLQEERDSKAARDGERAEEQEATSRPFHYLFSGTQIDVGPVRPKLLFVVDANTGEPLHASLTPETKNYLHQLAVAERLTNVRITEDDENADPSLGLGRHQTGSSGSTETNTEAASEAAESSPEAEEATPTESNPSSRPTSPRGTRLVEVPLTSDSEFFGVLEKELNSLAELQAREKSKITSEILTVGTQLSTATNPDHSKSRADLAKWRQLFELYLECNVFFATSEQNHGVHDGSKAQKQYELFLERARTQGLMEKFKMRESEAALRNFLTINQELLQHLKFQEINQLAMNKILKKFDKRTALNAKTTFPTHLPNSLISKDFSKALAYQVSTQILSIVPQLEDYLCPICFQIAYRPIRLRCGHLFCIRCLIVLQRAGKDNCALCREPTVMQADSTNLDTAMQNFMKRYFRDEARKKQKSNERAMYEEHNQEMMPFERDQSCSVM